MSRFEIGLARPGEAERCPEIEARASAIFPEEDVPQELADSTNDVETFAEAVEEERLLVARSAGEVVGFALVELDDPEPHLEELAVLPAFGQRGIGRALVDATCDRVAARGFASITLSTFRHLAWNAPLYARAGFVVVPPEAWTPALTRRAEEEARAGLDPDRRVMMRRSLGG